MKRSVSESNIDSALRTDETKKEITSWTTIVANC